MRRNWDIVREILLRLESAKTPNTVLNANAIDAYPEQEVAYNMRLLKEAEYINATIRESSTGDGHILNALAHSLTPTGHDLLDTIRNDSVWNRIKDTFTTKGLEMTFDLVIAVGKKIMESMLSL